MDMEEGDISVPASLGGTAAAGFVGGGGGGQGHVLIHHHHHDPASHISPNNPPPGGAAAINGPLEEQQHHAVVGYKSSNNNGGSCNGGGNKVAVRYRECLKNHAAAMGGSAMDGCGEFMPSGEEGTIEALTCSACSCHRNFHRKEVDGGGGGGHEHLLDWYHHHSPPHLNRVGRKVIVGHPHHKNMLGGHEAALLYPTGALIASRAPTPHQMIMPYSMGGSVPSESDEQDQDNDHPHPHHHHPMGGPGPVLTSARPTQMVKKRYRTKFTPEQKEKMLSFAEKVGWKIQRQEESVVQQFCQEIGVKRRVLKVWMHNNKHTLAKKIDTANDLNPSVNGIANTDNP